MPRAPAHTKVNNSSTKRSFKYLALTKCHQPAIAGNLRKGGAMRTCKLLRRKAASEYLHETHGFDCAPSTLAKVAVIGGGPIFRRIGRVPLYATDDLDEWVASKLSPRMRSTSVPVEPTTIFHQQAGSGVEPTPVNAATQ